MESEIELKKEDTMVRYKVTLTQQESTDSINNFIFG